MQLSSQQFVTGQQFKCSTHAQILRAPACWHRTPLQDLHTLNIQLPMRKQPPSQAGPGAQVYPPPRLLPNSRHPEGSKPGPGRWETQLQGEVLTNTAPAAAGHSALGLWVRSGAPAAPLPTPRGVPGPAEAPAQGPSPAGANPKARRLPRRDRPDRALPPRGREPPRPPRLGQPRPPGSAPSGGAGPILPQAGGPPGAAVPTLACRLRRQPRG